MWLLQLLHSYYKIGLATRAALQGFVVAVVDVVAFKTSFYKCKNTYKRGVNDQYIAYRERGLKQLLQNYSYNTARNWTAKNPYGYTPAIRGSNP